MQPRGPFDLLHQNQYFNGWPTLPDDPETVVMTFSVEGWSGSASVTLKQLPDKSIELHVYGNGDHERATQQGLASISLDQDGSCWPDVGANDPFVATLQRTYEYMRPSMFNSPYEAAAAFVIGHRISIVQTRKIRSAMADELGEKVNVDGVEFSAFPSPSTLLSLESFKGISDTKVDRLRAIAQAAIDGSLDRTYLRSLEPAAALAELQTLPGVGPFFAQGILQRGAGAVDGFTSDDMTFQAIKAGYELPDDATESQMLEIANRWRPYRMWVTVLLHVWLRERNNGRQ